MTQDQVNYLRPSPLLANLSASGNSSYKRYCVSPANIQFQETSADTIHLSGRPLLIKLHADHPCIDFLLIDKPAGVSSEKLFLIQSSVSRYQDCSGPKVEEVYQIYATLDASVLEFYSNKTKIPKKQFFFVYASTEEPNSETFSNSTSVSNKVYFLKLHLHAYMY